MTSSQCTRTTKQGRPCKSSRVSWFGSETPDPQSCRSHLTADECVKFDEIQARGEAEWNATFLAGVFSPRPPEPAPVTLAQALAETTANLDAYIERRAQEIAAPRIAAIEHDARERIAEVERQSAFDRQRASDLEAELRRHITALERRVQQLREETAS